MGGKRIISIMFYIVALYDGVLGAAFLIKPLRLIEWAGDTPPYHPGFIQFPALLLVVFAVMFIQIALDPARNSNLVPYGVLLKIAYCLVVFKYWFTTGVGAMWKPFAIIDAVTAVLFIWAYVILRQDAERSTQEAGG